MCLHKSAHGLAPNHDIFNKPFKVDVRYATEPTPEVYKVTAGREPIPSTLQTWRVQIEDFASHPEKWRPGVVATGKGFTDSPDCEVISGGMNKDMSAVAIGRQASFLFWGFDSPPSNATESARLAFLNSIVYISKFDGAPVLARKDTRTRAREWAYITSSNLTGPDDYPFLMPSG
jgi:hypothetical protein